MKLKNKDDQTLAEAYNTMLQKPTQLEAEEPTYTVRRTPYMKADRPSKEEPDFSFFKDKPEAPQDERQQSMSNVLKMSYDLNDVGSRLSSVYRRLKANESVDQEIKNALAKDGEALVAMSSEIEDIYNKYLSV